LLVAVVGLQVREAIAAENITY